MATVTQKYTKIPNEAVLALASKPGLLGLYARLMHYESLSKAKGNGVQAFPSQETLAQDLDTSERNVRRWADSLDELGWVTITRRGKRIANRYTVHTEPVERTLADMGDRTDLSGHEQADQAGDRTDLSYHSAGDRTDLSSTTGQICPPSNTDSTKTNRSSSKTDSSDAGASPNAGELDKTDKDDNLQPSLSGTSLSIKHQQQVSLSAAASSTVPPPAAPSAEQDIDADRAHSTSENSGGPGWVIAAVESKKYLEANLEPRYRVAARNKADELAVTGRYTAEQIIDTVLAELGLKGALV